MKLLKALKKELQVEQLLSQCMMQTGNLIVKANHMITPKRAAAIVADRCRKS